MEEDKLPLPYGGDPKGYQKIVSCVEILYKLLEHAQFSEESKALMLTDEDEYIREFARRLNSDRKD